MNRSWPLIQRQREFDAARPIDEMPTVESMVEFFETGRAAA